MKLPQLRELSGEAILNLVQTFGIIVALSVSAWGVHVQEVAKSAELTRSLTKDLSSGQSGVILMALEMRGNLDKTNVSDEAIDEFLDNYELVDMAYHHHLINWDMADDAFSYDLGKALNDAKIRRFLSESRGEEADVYDGVLELARALDISFPRSFRPSPLLALRLSSSLKCVISAALLFLLARVVVGDTLRALKLVEL
jgi:hypothetical protein